MPIVKVDDINMYYETHGEGEPLILISGNGAESSQWKDMIPTFSKNYRVIPFDNRGAGRTDRPDMEYSMDMMAADVIGLMDVLEIKKAHILGASMGGMIAQNIAHLYPDRVKSLILVVTSMKNSFRANYACKQAIKRVMDGSDPDALAEHSAIWSFPEEVLENPGAVDRIKSAMAPVLNPQTVDAFKRQNDALATFDSSNWISEITAPTLVIAGEGDIIWPKKYSGPELAKFIPDSKFVSLPGAHMAYILSAEAFQGHVMNFLSSIE